HDVAGHADRIRELEVELEASRTAAGCLAKDLTSQRAEHSRLLEVLNSVRSVLGGGPSIPPSPSVPGVALAATRIAETGGGRTEETTTVPPSGRSVNAAP